MAVISPRIEDAPAGFQVPSGVIVFVWTPVTEADTFGPAVVAGFADKSVQITGTLGGSTYAIQGTLDPDHVNGTYAGLKDAFGAVLTTLGLGVNSVLENVLAIKPVRTGGAATTVTVRLFASTTARR